MPNNKLPRSLTFIIFIVLPISLALIMSWAAYSTGLNAGRRAGRAEAFEISSINKAIDAYTIEVEAPNARGSTEKKAVRICDTLPVIVPELLARADANVTAAVIVALPQNTKVGVICASEQMINGVSWVNIVIEQPDLTARTGWIPGQDIQYPPVCMQGQIKPKELQVYKEPNASAEITHRVSATTKLDIICDSGTSVWGGEYWVRVKFVLDGNIGLGWVPAKDVIK